MSRVRRSGQSLVEVLVGIAIAAIFIIGAAAVVAPSLQENKQTSQLQMKAELADELMGNVRSWAGGNWNSVLSLATGTANPYYLNTNVSPFTPSATSTAGTTTSTAAIALVQSASSSADYSSSAYSTVSATFPSNTSSGDAIVVFLQHDSGSGRAVTGCRDSVDATSSYLLAARANNTGNSQESELWYAQNIAGGTTPTVTCTFSTNTPYDSIAIQEYRGIATTSALDATSTNIVTSASTALTTGTSTTHFNSELVFGGFVGTANGNWTFTPGAGFTTRIDQGTIAGLDTEDEVQSTAGPVSATATATPGDHQADIMATFEPGVITMSGSANATGTEAVVIGGITYMRYFYLSDVYRDANGNVTTTVAGNYYDPSTKLATVVVAASTTPATPATSISAYLTRNTSNDFSQSSWAGGPGVSTPVTLASSTYATSNNVTVSATGSIQLATGGNSCTD